MPDKLVVVCLVHQTAENLVKFYEQTDFLFPEVRDILEILVELVEKAERVLNTLSVLIYVLRPQAFPKQIGVKLD